MGTSGEERSLRGAGVRRAQSRRRGSLRARRRRTAAACLAGFLFAAIVASAHATLEPVLDPVKQNQDVGPASCQQTGNAACVDTEQTPIAKDGKPYGWSQVAGAEFPAAGDGTMDSGASLKVIKDVEGKTIVPADVDFFTLAVKDETDAYAGGSECKDPIPADKTEAGEIADYVRSCERVPIIYHYTQPDPDHPGTWSPEYKGDSQGYVGGLAYTADGLIVAAGGTGLSKSDASDFGAQIYTPENGPGAYPYREDCDPAKSPITSAISGKLCTVDLNAAEAGSARVWMTHDGSPNWCEAYTPGGCDGKLSGPLPSIDDGNGASTPMDGITGLDCSPRTTDAADCVAGGYQQLWEWHKDHFDRGIDAQTSAAAGIGGDLGFRVRSVRFAPGLALNPVQPVFGETPTSTVPQVGVTTSGCCDASPANDQPVLLTRNSHDWGGTGRNASSARLPDSYYSVSLFASGTGGYSTWTLAAPGGPAPGPDDPPDPPSDPPFHAGTATNQFASSTTNQLGLSSVRLVSADGDSQETPSVIGRFNRPDGVADWAVGAVGRTGQGVMWNSFVSKLDATALPGKAINCPAGVNPTDLSSQALPITDPNEYLGILSTQLAKTNCKPANQQQITDLIPSQALLRTDSFSLNSVSLVYTGIDRSQQTGDGWAVGDRGGIVRFGSGATTAAAGGGKSLPPQLGAHNQGGASASSAYDPFRQPANGSSSAVPSLATQPLEHPAEPRLVAGGIPDATRQGPHPDSLTPPGEVPASIVMSRDGTEGWALGSWDAVLHTEHTALFHYARGTWKRCDPVGVPDPHGGPPIVPADPACASLAAFATTHSDVTLGGSRKPYASITAATRIPLENDSDPSNDDELQIAAVGFDANTTATILWYRDGRWSIDHAASDQIAKTLGDAPGLPFGDFTPNADLAFAGPNDGWLLLAPNPGLGGNDPSFGGSEMGKLFHYDGTRWADCTDPANSQACDDPPQGPSQKPELQSLVSEGAGPFHLATAGNRVYLAGSRALSSTSQSRSVPGSPPQTTPVILYRDPNGTWSGASPGGVDPGFDHPDSVSQAEQGSVSALSVVRTGGGYEGWAMGEFGPPLGRGVREAIGESTGGQQLTGGQNLASADSTGRQADTSTLLRLGGDGWSRWTVRDAADQYLLGIEKNRLITPDYVTGPPASQIVSLPGGRAILTPYLAQTSGAGGPGVAQTPSLVFDPARGHWVALDTPFTSEEFNSNTFYVTAMAAVSAIAPDNQGGAWLSVIGAVPAATAGAEFDGYIATPVSFYHYTDEVRKPLFEDVAHPIREQMTAATGGPDGSFWVTTKTGAIYRYDRISGWDKMTVPGWDPGRLTTNPSPAEAIAIGPDGSGIVVGKAGRIADVSPTGARLDSAAGTICDPDKAVPPCGTAATLRAAAVAAGGAALASGDNKALLWRPASGDFRAIAPPSVAAGVIFTALALSPSGQAWVVTNDGKIFAGQIDSDGGVTWRTELHDRAPDLNARDKNTGLPLSRQLGFRAICLDSSGRGYAVGSKGLVFQRHADGSWTRILTGLTDNFYSVAVSPNGKAAVIGGEFGRILTLVDGHFEVAREADRWNPYSALDVLGRHVDPAPGDFVNPPSAIVGVAIAPGSGPGQVEAWAANQVDESASFAARRVEQPVQILHYTNDTSDPLLDPGRRALPLRDSPSPRPGEIGFATFGKSECRLFYSDLCPGARGTNQTNDVQLGAIVSSIAAEAAQPGGPRFALYTGDATDQPGTGNPYNQTGLGLPTDMDFVHQRFAEAVADPLAAAGVPFYSALGNQDIERAKSPVPCLGEDCSLDPRSINGLGTALGWRSSFAQMPAPWGGPGVAGSPSKSGEWTFCPVTDGQSSVANSDTQVPNPATSGSFSLPTGGARTHYAFDITDGSCGEGAPLARVVVADTSQGSLAASAASDQPHEATTQLNWLKSALCIQGDQASAGQSCTRPASEQAVVVSEDPSYSYGPSSNNTEQDATTFEALMQQYRVNAVVSGRLGWNGLYWALAPGVHEPCPGGGYPNPSEVPDLAHIHPCSSQVGGAGGAGGALDTAETLAAGISAGTNPPTAKCSGEGANQTGTVPYVVASSAGGKFAQDAPGASSGAVGDPRADQGYWHGYTVVRLDKSGDPRCTIVETRPVFDWVGIDGGKTPSHMLRPGQKLDPIGYGREPNGFDTPVQYDAINGFAITHRYDLLYADPDHPWLPRSDPNDPACDLPHDYCPITDSRVGTVDPVTGEVKSGDGSQPRTFAIVELSVGEHFATYPLVFEPRPSFRQPPAPPAIELPPASAPPPAPAPPAPAPPFQPPTLATPPPVTPLPAQTPPVPPVPPAPPTGGPTQLDLFTSPPVLSVSPTVSLFPPSAPVINVAPPTPARPVEKAKKVAVQSSGSDSDAAASQKQQDAAGDLAQSGPDRSAMTRHENNFTALAHRDQASAWARDLQWGGGLTLMALVAAFGWITVRPTPRRRQPEVPAPSRAGARWR
jgi:hypothetical protein